MKNYSIEKVGSDYVVKVDDQSVMKVGSRRRAAQLVVDASELLNDVPLVPDDLDRPVTDRDRVTDDGDAPPSITRDSAEGA